MNKQAISNTKTFSDAFATLRKSFYVLLGITFLILAASLFMIVLAFRTADHKIYVLSQSGMLTATADYDHKTSIYEIRSHVKNFCSGMFAWDKDNFNGNVEQALNLVDHGDGVKMFNTFKENEVYENLVSTGARVTLNIDSIVMDMEHFPSDGRFYLTQTWHTPAGEQSQGIGASFQIVQVSRSDKNPFGLWIQKIN